MGGVDEEADFLVGHLPLLAQDDDAQGAADDGEGYQRIQEQCPGAEPERLFDDDFHAPLFQDDTAVFAGDGAYPQGVFTRADVGEPDDVFVPRLAPSVVEAFQLPGVEDERRIIVIDFRDVQREDVLVVGQPQFFRFVKFALQGRILAVRIDVLIEYPQVAEYHFEFMVAREFHVFVELHGSVYAAEDEVPVFPQRSRDGVEVVGPQSLFLGPVHKGLFVGFEGSQSVFGAEEEVLVAVGQDGADVV